jgi:DNA invertase Pin-like site-specific DNA recombinase
MLKVLWAIVALMAGGIEQQTQRARPVVGVYVRISDDKDNDERGVTRQIDQLRALVEKANWDVHHVYKDNDLTAADRRVVRPEFEQMLADLLAGVIDGIVAVHIDRIARQTSDIERMEELWSDVERSGRSLLPITTTTGSFDLHTDVGVQTALFMVMMAGHEVRSTRRRARNFHADAAKKGSIPGGPIPFGWNEDRKTVHPVKGEAIRDAVLAVSAGAMGWNQVAIEWNRAGLLTPFGNTWIGANVRATLLNPRLAGIRTYKEEPLTDLETGEFVMGKWDPILTLDEWAAWWTIVGHDRGGGKDRARRDHLLSGVLRCGKCHHKMLGKKDNSRGILYVCPPKGAGGCAGVSIRAKHVEPFISELVLSKIETQQAQRLAAATWRGYEKLANVRAELDRLFDEMKAGKPSARRVAVVETLEAREAELLREKAQAEARVERQQRLSGDVRQEWEEKSNRAKRDLILDTLHMVLVEPHRGPNNKMNPDRLKPIWVGEMRTEAPPEDTPCLLLGDRFDSNPGAA